MTTRSASNPNALVLPPEAVSTGEAVSFPGFPGEWRPGNPVRLETLGLDITTARALIEQLGLPLVELEHRKREEAAIPDPNPPRHEGNAPFDPALAPPEPPSEADAGTHEAPPATPAAPADDTPGGAQ